MSRSRCEREIEVAGASRTGSWTEELSRHLRECAICAETRQVAESLLRNAAVLRSEYEPAPADQVWRRAQMRRQEAALRRATRPLIFMRVLSLACMGVFAAWILRGSGRFYHSELARVWNLGGAGTVLIGAVIAVACIAIGAWYLLYEGKRSGSVISST